jgi:hypothetical protein
LVRNYQNHLDIPQLATFKAQSEALSDSDRKDFAEKIALAFYSSLGGESDEDEDSEAAPDK